MLSRSVGRGSGLRLLLLSTRRRFRANVKPSWNRLRRRLWLLPLLLAISLVGAACSSGGETSAPSTTSTTASRITVPSTTSSSTTSSTLTTAPSRPIQKLPYAINTWPTDLTSSGWSATEAWQTASGQLVNSGKGYGTGLSATAPVTLDGVANYAVDADMLLVSYANSALASFGVVVRATGSNDGYGAGHCAAGGLYSCGQKASSEWSAVIWGVDDQSAAMGATPFRPGTDWHHYRVEVRGNTLTLIVDDSLVLGPVTDNRYLRGGRVGLWSNSVQVSVRNFGVAAL